MNAVLLVLAVLFWAGNFVFGAAAVETIDPVSLSALRWTAAAVPLLVIGQLVERPDWRVVRRHLPMLAFLGVIGFLGFGLLMYFALETTTPLTASLINGLNPAVIVVASAIVHRTGPRPLTIAGLALGLLGVLLVITKGDLFAIARTAYTPGDLLMLGAITVWAVYVLLWHRLRAVPAITATGVQAAASALVILPVALATGLRLPADPATWAAVGYIVLFPSIGSYLLWNIATRRVRPGVAAMYLNLVVVFAALIGLPFGYGITGVEVVGGVLVIASVVLTNIAGRGDAGTAGGTAPEAAPRDDAPREDAT